MTSEESFLEFTNKLKIIENTIKPLTERLGQSEQEIDALKKKSEGLASPAEGKTEDVNEALNKIQESFNTLKEEQTTMINQESETNEQMKTKIGSIELSIGKLRKDLEANQTAIRDIKASIEEIETDLLKTIKVSEELFEQNNIEINSANEKLDELKKQKGSSFKLFRK